MPKTRLACFSLVSTLLPYVWLYLTKYFDTNFCMFTAFYRFIYMFYVIYILPWGSSDGMVWRALFVSVLRRTYYIRVVSNFQCWYGQQKSAMCFFITMCFVSCYMTQFFIRRTLLCYVCLMSSQIHLSVICRSVTLVHHTQTGWTSWQYFCTI